MIAAGFPAPPSDGVDIFGPLSLNFYAVCIVVGIIAAYLLAVRLWRSRGGAPEHVVDALLWAVLLGIVGGRLYHVFSSPDAYFGPGFDGSGDLSLIPQIWLGGLGIWGAVALGAVGVWIACRRYGMKFGAFADAVVPGVLLAQAIGRWGNWFNQELYGGPTNLPWGLNVDMEYRVEEVSHMSENTLFHPTFLYESLWNLAGAVLLLLLWKRFQFKQGLLAWTYVAYYTLGRFWIENLRIDELDKSTQWISLLGVSLRLNVWVSLVMFLVAVGMMVWLWTRRPRTDEALAEELQSYHPGFAERPEATTEEGLEEAEEDPEEDASDSGTEAEPEEAESEEDEPGSEETEEDAGSDPERSTS